MFILIIRIRCQAQNDNQSLLDIAKSDAIHLVNSCSNETRFYILTNDKSTNKIYSLEKEQAKNHIQNATLTSANMKLNQLILNQKNNLIITQYILIGLLIYKKINFTLKANYKFLILHNF